MVVIVTTLNVAATITVPEILIFAAGYINNGIKGSHGPKRKITKRTQGVTLPFDSSVWGWR